MPRLGFIPGQEALAADLMTLQDGTVHRFSDPAQRDAQWPAPVLGALSLINQFPTSLDIWESEYRLWQPLIYKPGSSGQQLITNQITDRVMNTSYPTAAYAQFSSSGGYMYLIGRATAGLSRSTVCLLIASSAQYTTLAAPQASDARLNSSKVQLYANKPTQSLWVLSDFTGADAGWIVGGQDSARPTRYKLTVAGNISADNLVGMETRLARLEALLDLPPLPDPHMDDLTQPPLPEDDPRADPDYLPEDETDE